MTNPINTDAAPSDQDVMISLLQSINDKLGHLVAEGEERDRVNAQFNEESDAEFQAEQERRAAREEKMDSIITMAQSFLKYFQTAYPVYGPGDTGPKAPRAPHFLETLQVPFAGSTSAFGAPPFTPTPAAAPPPTDVPKPPSDFMSASNFVPAGGPISYQVTNLTSPPKQYVTVPLSYIGELVMALAKRGS